MTLTLHLASFLPLFFPLSTTNKLLNIGSHHLANIQTIPFASNFIPQLVVRRAFKKTNICSFQKRKKQLISFLFQASGYVLNLGAFVDDPSPGDFVGDSLTPHNGKKFSTRNTDEARKCTRFPKDRFKIKTIFFLKKGHGRGPALRWLAESGRMVKFEK